MGRGLRECRVCNAICLSPWTIRIGSGAFAFMPNAAAAEQLPAHLRSSGVTAIALMPVHHFVDDRHLGEQGLRNYWGYNTLGFFAPEPRFAVAGATPCEVVLEFKQTVKDLHNAGFEVILDVVHNHTTEGNQTGPTDAHDAPVDFRLANELPHSGWKIAFETARPELAVERESVKRNRFVKLAERSFVLLSHER